MSCSSFFYENILDETILFFFFLPLLVGHLPKQKKKVSTYASELFFLFSYWNKVQFSASASGLRNLYMMMSQMQQGTFIYVQYNLL